MLKVGGESTVNLFEEGWMVGQLPKSIKKPFDPFYFDKKIL